MQWHRRFHAEQEAVRFLSRRLNWWLKPQLCTFAYSYTLFRNLIEIGKEYGLIAGGILLRFLANGWCTAARFGGHAACLFGGEGPRTDHILHYLVCPIF